MNLVWWTVFSNCRRALIAKSKSHSAIGFEEEIEQTDLFRVTEDEIKSGVENIIHGNIRRSQTQVGLFTYYYLGE